MKKYSYKPFKAVAFLMCLVMFGTSALAGYRVVEFAWRAGYYYGFDNFSKAIYDTRLSKDFLDEAGFVYYAAKRTYVTYDDGAAFDEESFIKKIETSKAKQIDAQARDMMSENSAAAAEYNAARASGKSDGEYITYDDDGNNHSEKMYGGYYESYFKTNEGFIVKADGTVSADYDYFYKIALDQYGNEYNLAQYKTECERLKTYLSSLKSMEYLIVDSTTGKVYTNSDYKTAEGFASAYSDNTWYISSKDNFDSATVGKTFADLSAMTDTSAGIANFDPQAVATTTGGAMLSSSAYLGQFFSSMRYGYIDRKNQEYDYALGSIEFFDSNPCSIYMSYDTSRADAADPFTDITNGYLDVVSHLAQDAAVLIIALFIAAVLAIWLIIIAGRDYNGAPLRMLWEDKIFSDVRLVLSGGVVAGLSMLAGYIAYIGLYKPRFIELCSVGFVLLAVLAFAVLLDYTYSFVRRCKDGTILSHTLIFLPIKLIIKAFKRLRGNNSKLPDGVKKQFKLFVPCYLVLVLISAVFIAVGKWMAVIGFIDLIIINTVFFMLLYAYAKSLDKIRSAVEEAHRGNYNVSIDSSSMPLPVVRLANEINDMRDGMQKAINTAIQDQRTKTELITNVSHDLKTPLTSIITYADLIRRSNIEDENVRGYVDVLTEKSLRLKQLIEDLTEATKASTGNVDFQITDVNLYELALQAIGENEDCLEQAQIEACVTPTDLRPIVRADGQKTYRVFENAISNISKYAMPKTRAYLSFDVTPEYGIIAFKNISRAPLDIPPEQLMERFVRGDASRNGEGSGLGLSIARDLCVLQGGKFEIGIDGDMFKATVYLPLSPSQQTAPVDEQPPANEQPPMEDQA